MSISERIATRIPTLRRRLETIYPHRTDEAVTAIGSELSAIEVGPNEAASAPWSERDVVLITYADQLRDASSEDEAPLATLRHWLIDEGLQNLLSTVHLLPFCPYTSDDGFSVVDYLQVDPEAGDWDAIAALGNEFDLMYDLVLNHISKKSDWFQAFLRGESPYDRFFIHADPALDYTSVVRPRSHPLLTPVEADGKTTHVWTTFSDDQIDLNYGEPVVLARMLRILVEYAHRGARILRLDAIAFLWKRLGTNCLHLTETHEVVRLMRDVLAAFAPGTLVLTETNVPHRENVSYFGASDEAHMVYQFSLPPLLLDAFLSGDAVAITAWLSNLSPPPPGCTFFNFTASHDGVGMRPLEGLVSDDRLHRLVEAVRARGGRINTRRQADGSDTPYELCITYFEAIAPDEPDPSLHVRRFLASQAVMLALQGMPALYFHSLVGTPNDTAGADTSGMHRRINRHKYDRKELDTLLADSGGVQRQVFDGYRALLACRIAQPAFHPDVPQSVVPQTSPNLLAFERTPAEGYGILVGVNFSDDAQTLDLPAAYQQGVRDLLRDAALAEGPTCTLAPGQAVWLTR